MFEEDGANFRNRMEHDRARDDPSSTIKELTEKAIHEYRRECNKK